MDLLALVGVLVTSAAAGLALLDRLGAEPRAPLDRLVAGLAAGLGLAGVLGLGLAAVGGLRVLPILAAGLLALLAGGRSFVQVVSGLGWPRTRATWGVLAVSLVVLLAEVPTMFAPPVGGDQTKYQLVYPRLYAAAGRLVATPWTFWGQMQFLENFVFAIAFVLRGDVLARLLNAATGVLAAVALGRMARRHLGRAEGLATGVLFFTLPITWSLMTRAGVDLVVVLFGALAVDAFLTWSANGAAGPLRRAALMAGLAGGSKVMGLLLPGLLGLGVLVRTWQRPGPLRSRAAVVMTFGLLVAIAAAPWYARNAIDTGNPLYPFGYSVFGGRHWSRAAAEYLGDYYQQYQSTWANRREGSPYAGLAVASFPWDLTMTPGSFEKGARQALDVSPFGLAFAPALVLVPRRRAAALTVGVLGLAYAGIIAGAAWAHPRYVLPGVALVLVASVAGARALLGRRVFAIVVGLTVASNLAVTTRLLQPMWPDQVRVALGRLSPAAFLGRYSDRFVFWERANQVIPEDGRVLVLEKIPHPYYIERPFVLGSYLEQGLIDYRTVNSPDALAGAAALLGITHISVDVAGLDAASDPFEARVTGIWRALVTEQGIPVLRAGGFGLYQLRHSTPVYGATGPHHG